MGAETSPDIQGHARLCGCAACRAGTTAAAPEPQNSVILTTVDNAGGGNISFLTTPYYVSGLLPSDEYRWNGHVEGSGLTLTYGFMTTMPSYAQGLGSNEEGPFRAFTAAQQAAVHRAVQNYEEVCNVDFVYMANGDNATVRFGSAVLDPNSAAHAYYPQRSANGDWEGDVWFNHTVADTATQTPGSYGYFVTLHEIGHTLGLKHPHEWQDGGTQLPYNEDSRQYTVMSYQGHPNYSYRAVFTAALRHRRAAVSVRRQHGDAQREQHLHLARERAVHLLHLGRRRHRHDQRLEPVAPGHHRPPRRRVQLHRLRILAAAMR